MQYYLLSYVAKKVHVELSHLEIKLSVVPEINKYDKMYLINLAFQCMYHTIESNRVVGVGYDLTTVFNIIDFAYQ